MENENLDLEVKPAGNKDLWLFLIIVDIVFLCIFGFFLYKHFSTGLFHFPANENPAAVEEVTDAPEVVEVETTTVEVVEEPAPAPAPAAAPAKPEEPAASSVAAQPEEVALTAITEEPAKTESAVSAAQKESIVVAGNPKSKYRKVTFRWFGDGQKVQIVSGFTMSKPQSLKKKGDHWETTLSIAPGTYKFLYIIDGENRTDPYAPEKDGRSVVEVK